MKRYLFLVTVIMLCTAHVFVPAMAASKPVSMHADVGFQTFYDPQVWTPVRITLFNPGGRTIFGHLIFPIHKQSGFSYEGNFSWPIRVPKGTSTVTLGLPGELLETGQSVRFLQNNTLISTVRVAGVPVASSDIAGVISDQPEAVQFLAGVSSANSTAQMVTAYIPPATVPTSSELLQGLSYLYIDGKSASELTAKQVQAIKQWVYTGGILLLGGLEPNAGQVGALTSLSPVTGMIVVDGEATALAKFASQGTPHGIIPMLYGIAHKGATVLVGSRNHALVAVSSIGRGQVAYLGVQANTSNLVTWTGNAVFWDTLLQQLHQNSLPVTLDLFGPNGLWTMMNAAELFPQLHMPPLWIWEVVFGLYVLITGPILYLILRKYRKNEWAWIVLPMASLGVAIVIYIQGVEERPNGILTQSVGLVDIVNDHLAQAVGVQALMSPQKRSYNIVTRPNTWMIPLADRVTGAVKSDALVTMVTKAPTTEFSNVRAWGGRFIYATRTMSTFGNLQGELFANNHSLGGFLVNQSAVDYSDVVLIDGHQVFPLGHLKRGASINVDVLFKTHPKAPFAAQLSAGLSSANHGIGRALFPYLNTFTNVAVPSDMVLLVGWSNTEPNIFANEGSAIPAEPQWIVRQLMPVTKVVE